MKHLLLLPMLVLLSGASGLPSNPELGKAEGRCRSNEPGPALLVSPIGLKDRSGNLKLEVYPANDTDFLQDDNILIMAGKVFRRVEVAIPAAGEPVLCIRVPTAGSYSVALLHDRDQNHKFNWIRDGIGFSGNPKLGWSKPPAAATKMVAGPGMTQLHIVMNYRHGMGVAPIKQ
ncbi:MAG: hypothetical protein RLZZ427_228 [Pseudomonadota bacterium]|jgi:uncharacterized protein (DUF2141 family)